MPGRGRQNGTEPRNAANDSPYREGFEPTTVAAEVEDEGWLRTTTPEGVSDGERNALTTSGSRGDENTRRRTVSRTTRRRARDS